jgi:phage gpG-like protein
MDIRARIDVDVSKAMSHLDGMSGRASNFRPIFWYAQAELELANAANFNTNGLPSGGWAPRTQVYTWPIMRKTGALFSSLTSLRGAPNDIGRKQAIFGTTVEYARFHQEGTRHLPKRLVVFEPPLFAKRLALAAAEYVADGVVP